jgi:hypothetical protein
VHFQIIDLYSKDFIDDSIRKKFIQRVIEELQYVAQRKVEFNRSNLEYSSSLSNPDAVELKIGLKFDHDAYSLI